jgi:starch synthase
MRILMVASEANPFAKTGGLADVASGLSKALAGLGHEVTLALPYYRKTIKPNLAGEPVGKLIIPVGEKRVEAEIRSTTLPGSQVRVLLIDQPSYFDRAGLYLEKGHDYADNAERFSFFSRAVLEAARFLDLQPDIVHANDWQTGLIPAMLASEYRLQPWFQKTASVFTIHNMAFQGRFPWWDYKHSGLRWDLFNWRQLEYYGELNMLKAGIAMSEIVNTVSPTYAREICQPEFGYGLDPSLLARGDALCGILNGVDTTEWNPATDAALAQRYTLDTVKDGKAACKAALQREVGLPQKPDSMLLGVVSRLTDQKGLGLIAARAAELFRADIQFICLGAGELKYENWLQELKNQFPNKVASVVGFNEALAHRIEAGIDAFLMPSQFEPCGLNQMYSLAYGSPPIVSNVGGLADSVVDCTPESMGNRTGNGFKFTQYTSEAFLACVWKAVGVFQHDKPTWNRLIKNGMSRDWSWAHSAADYVRIYDSARSRVR